MFNGNWRHVAILHIFINNNLNKLNINLTCYLHWKKGHPTINWSVYQLHTSIYSFSTTAHLIDFSNGRCAAEDRVWSSGEVLPWKGRASCMSEIPGLRITYVRNRRAWEQSWRNWTRPIPRRAEGAGGGDPHTFKELLPEPEVLKSVLRDLITSGESLTPPDIKMCPECVFCEQVWSDYM